MGCARRRSGYRMRYHFTGCFARALRTTACYLDLTNNPLCGFPCGRFGRSRGLELGNVNLVLTNSNSLGVVYIVSILAYNSQGDGAWGPQTQILIGSPPIPSGLSISPLESDGSKLQVGWAASALPSHLEPAVRNSATVPTSRSVRWRNVTVGEGFAEPVHARAVNIATGTLSYTISGAVGGNTYEVQVAATNSNGRSHWAQPVQTQAGTDNVNWESLEVTDAADGSILALRPSFSAVTQTYMIEVQSDIANTIFTINTVDAAATIKNSAGLGTGSSGNYLSAALSSGPNIHHFDVTSSNGQVTRRYTLNVFRNTQLTFDPAQTDLRLYGGVAAPHALPSAGGGTPPYAYTLSALPSGMVFTASTNTISGTPSVGQSTTTITEMVHTATDANNITGMQTFDIRVAVAPVFAAAVPAVLVRRLNVAALAQILPAMSGGHSPRVYALNGALPTGLAFNTSTRALSGTPSALADATMTYTAKDAGGTAGSARGIITSDIRIRVLDFDFDLDGNGVGTSDAIMVARYLLGVRGVSLIAGQSSGDAATIGGKIQNGIDLGIFNVDGDADTDGNDGIMIARYALGLRGDDLIDNMPGAVASIVAGNVAALLQ